jgi:hypothetical protein
MDWGRCRPNAGLLRQSVGGLGREKFAAELDAIAVLGSLDNPHGR